MDEWLGLGKPITRNAIPWLSATVTLGLLFLAGQWIAWRQLAAQQVFSRANQNSQSSHFFYLITGVHATHLFLGIAALVAALVGLNVSRQLETRQILVDGVAWYWHAMGILWLFLFTLLAFFQ
jgi:cytochrome c oxidase subunit 3